MPCPFSARRCVGSLIAFQDVGDQDVEWFLRLLEHPIEVIIHPDVVLTYRRHAENMTGSLSGSRRQFLLALQRAVVRRRQSQRESSRTATVTFITQPHQVEKEGKDDE